MIARRRAIGSPARALSLVLLSGAISTVLVRSSVAGESAAVTVRAQAVSEDTVKSAVNQCRQSAEELPVATCVDRFFVPRWLLDAEVKERKLAGTSQILEQKKRILSRRMLELSAEKSPEPTASQIDSYLKKHERDFVKPLRVRIFRILVSTEEKAHEISKKLSQTTTPAEFRELARSHSIDKATSERGGDLGFVWPDGSTDVPQVSADPALYQAALPLSEGEFSPAPIPEGEHFAVIWRRGSLPAQAMDENARAIARLRLLEGAAEESTTSLLGELSKNVRGRNDELLGKLRRPEATLFKEL